MREELIEEWSRGEIELLANALEDALNDNNKKSYTSVVRNMLSKVNRGNVLSILVFQNRLWCCTNSGVFVYNPEMQVFQRVGGV